MKLQLNKKKLKNLSKDNQALPMDVTPQVGGGYLSGAFICVIRDSIGCPPPAATLDAGCNPVSE
jgi:hypothetical protein